MCGRMCRVFTGGGVGLVEGEVWGVCMRMPGVGARGGVGFPSGSAVEVST